VNYTFQVPLGLETKWQESFDLTGDKEPTIDARVIERFYPKSISRREDETPLLVVKHKRIFASQLSGQR
jgi:hypothetical protein